MERIIATSRLIRPIVGEERSTGARIGERFGRVVDGQRLLMIFVIDDYPLEVVEVVPFAVVRRVDVGDQAARTSRREGVNAIEPDEDVGARSSKAVLLRGSDLIKRRRF